MATFHLQAPFFAASASATLATVVAFFYLHNPIKEDEEENDAAAPLAPAAEEGDEETAEGEAAASAARGGGASAVLTGIPDAELTLSQRLRNVLIKRKYLITLLLTYFFNMAPMIAFTTMFIPLISRDESVGWSSAGCEGTEDFVDTKFGCDSKGATKQGMAFATIAVISVLAQAMLFGALTKRMSTTMLGIVSSGIRTAALVIIPLLKDERLLFPALALFGIGHFLATPCLPSLLSSYVKANFSGSSTGKVMGYGQASSSLASAVMPLLMGFVGDLVDIRYPFFIAAGLSAICLLSFLAIDVQLRTKKDGPSKADRRNLGDMLSNLLMDRGYRLWYQHLDAVTQVLEGAFPDVSGTNDDERIKNIGTVIRAAKKRKEEWDYMLGSRFDFAGTHDFSRINSIQPDRGAGAGPEATVNESGADIKDE